MSQRNRLHLLRVVMLACWAGALLVLPAACNAAISWNFDDALPATGLPVGWSKFSQFGTWSSAESNLQIGSGKVLAATFFPPKTKTLWFNEDVFFPDAFRSTMETFAIPSWVNCTPASSPLNFAEELQSGQYGLAILLKLRDADSIFQPADYDTAFSALSQFVAAGGRAIASDAQAVHTEGFGTAASLRQTPIGSITVNDLSLAEGNPTTISIPNSLVKLTPTSGGTSAATIADGNGHAIVMANDGRTIFNSFSSHEFANVDQGKTLYKNEIAFQISAVFNNGAAAASGIGLGSAQFPAQQPQLQVDSFSPPFRIPDPSNSALSFDFKLSVSEEGDNNSVDFSFVDETNGESFVWAPSLAGGDPTHVEVCFNSNTSCPVHSNITANKTYRLRIRVQDSDIDLTTFDRVEVDNMAITGNAILVGLPGDYNGDNVVDAVDYVVWRNNFGQLSTSLLNRDPSNSGPVNENDYTFWKARFGNSLAASSTTSAAVAPEPTSTMLMALSGIAAGLIRKNRRRTLSANGEGCS